MKKKVLCIVAMLISMCLATIISILLLSYIFFKMEISEDKIIIGTLIIYIISCFVGGFIYGKIKEKNKYIHGMSIGAIYFIVLLLISIAFSKDFSLISIKTLYSGLTCILGGMLGGMLS